MGKLKEDCSRIRIGTPEYFKEKKEYNKSDWGSDDDNKHYIQNDKSILWRFGLHQKIEACFSILYFGIRGYLLNVDNAIVFYNSAGKLDWTWPV